MFSDSGNEYVNFTRNMDTEELYNKLVNINKTFIGSFISSSSSETSMQYSITIPLNSDRVQSNPIPSFTFNTDNVIGTNLTINVYSGDGSLPIDGNFKLEYNNNQTSLISSTASAEEVHQAVIASLNVTRVNVTKSINKPFKQQWMVDN
jgi:hypothetical protein